MANETVRTASLKPGGIYLCKLAIYLLFFTIYKQGLKLSIVKSVGRYVNMLMIMHMLIPGDCFVGQSVFIHLTCLLRATSEIGSFRLGERMSCHVKKARKWACSN